MSIFMVSLSLKGNVSKPIQSENQTSLLGNVARSRIPIFKTMMKITPTQTLTFVTGVLILARDRTWILVWDLEVASIICYFATIVMLTVCRAFTDNDNDGMIHGSSRIHSEVSLPYVW